MAYSDRLRELRAERQLSLRQVEERGGPNKDTMSLLERGEHKPRAQTLGRIAMAFDMSVAELRADLEAAENPLGAAPPSEVAQRSFDHLLAEERRTKLAFVETFIHGYAFSAMAHWLDKLERGRTAENITADEAFEWAAMALEEFSRIHGWLYDESPAHDLLEELEDQADVELGAALDALIDALVQRTAETQHAVFEIAERVAETEQLTEEQEQQRARFAERRQKAEAGLNAATSRWSA